MPRIDLRTIYTGSIKQTRKHYQEVADISEQVANIINEIFDNVREGDLLTARDSMAELGQFETQISDLLIKLHDNTDSGIIDRLKMILDMIVRAQRRLERIMSSIQTEVKSI